MQKLMTFLNVKRMWQNTKIGQRYMISLIVSFLLFAASMVNAYFIVLNIRQDMNTVEDANNKYSEI
jgi:cell division protein FtsL